METLLDVKEFLNDVDNINSGGCGVAALAMYRWMEKNNMLKGNETFTFLYVSNDDFFYDNNEKYFKGKEQLIIAPAHVVLNIDGTYVDSTRRSNNLLEYRYPRKHVNVTEEELIKSLNNPYWNDSFERNCEVPFIADELGIDLSDVDLMI
jgi:hypothetical protein